MLQELWEAIAPNVVELIMSVVTLILGAAAMKFRSWANVNIDARYLEMEDKHMRALQSAIRSGVLYAMEGGTMDRDKMVDAAIKYAKESVPDALAYLMPGDGLLAKMVRGKLGELLGAA